MQTTGGERQRREMKLPDHGMMDQLTGKAFIAPAFKSSHRVWMGEISHMIPVDERIEKSIIEYLEFEPRISICEGWGADVEQGRNVEVGFRLVSS